MYHGLHFDSPVGRLLILEDQNTVTHLLYPGQPSPEGVTMEETALLRRTCEQLTEYFAGKRVCFDLPLAPMGTAFRRSVWEQLRRIPYGETRSYREIAVALGNPAATRAVGQANHHNPISIIIPCHRVIGANGSLTGYGGGMQAKTFLLELEKGGSPLG